MVAFPAVRCVEASSHCSHSPTHSVTTRRYYTTSAAPGLDESHHVTTSIGTTYRERQSTSSLPIYGGGGPAADLLGPHSPQRPANQLAHCCPRQRCWQSGRQSCFPSTMSHSLSLDAVSQPSLPGFHICSPPQPSPNVLTAAATGAIQWCLMLGAVGPGCMCTRGVLAIMARITQKFSFPAPFMLSLPASLPTRETPLLLPTPLARSLMLHER